jgi:hypothetical protein
MPLRTPGWRWFSGTASSMRPAPGEHLRPRVGAPRPRRLRSGGKLSDDDMAKLTMLFVDAATGERRRDPAAAPRPRCPLRRVARAGVPRRSCSPVRPLLRKPASRTSTRCR